MMKIPRGASGARDSRLRPRDPSSRHSPLGREPRSTAHSSTFGREWSDVGEAAAGQDILGRNDRQQRGLTAEVESNNIVITVQHTIHITIRAVGNSKGVVLPKPVLAQAGLADAASVEMTVENGAIILRRPATPARVGWAEAAERIAGHGDDALVMGEFGNEDDAGLSW